MKTLRALVLGGGLLALSAIPVWSAAAPAPAAKTDVAPPQKRQDAVDKAARLTKAPAALQLPAEMTNPFNPAGFDAPDPDDQKPGTSAGARPTTGGTTAQAAPAGPTSDRDLLETMAPRIQPTGSLVIPGRPPFLTFPGAKRVGIGQVISVTFNEKEYDLEVIAIDGKNFTLRYRGEELTRSIKPIK